jgi:hypothetical protein
LKGFIIGLLLFISTSVYGQTITQTYTDRCTGEVSTFQINSQGLTVIVFYNRSKAFTAADVTSGKFKQWLDETYNWWRSINPCSVAQATTTVTQIVTNNIPSVPSSPPPPTSANNSNTGNAPQETTTSTSTSDSTAEPTSNTTESEETVQNNSDDSSSESNEADSESNDSDSQDNENDEDKESDESKKKNVLPPILASNIMTMSNADGSISIVTSVGVAQSSLLGDITYGANLMIWDNLRQYALNLSKSKLHFDKENNLKLISNSSVNVIYAYGTKVITAGVSDVYLGKRNTWKEGLILGYAANLMGVFAENTLITYSLTGFGTKPFLFNRKTISPLIAVTTSPFINPLTNRLSYSLSSVIGCNLDFALTQRFKANIGGNVIASNNSTLIYSITIGSRFQF